MASRLECTASQNSGVEMASASDIEVLKLVVDVFMPIAVLFLGVTVHRITSGLEARHVLNQQLIARRLDIFGEVAPLLNRVYCYHLRIGGWKDLQPPGVVSLKREIDERIYPNFAILGADILSKYNDLMAALFLTYQGRGTSACLRTGASEYSARHDWKSEWEECFAPDGQGSNRATVHELYVRFMIAFGLAVGVVAADAWSPPLPASPTPPGRPT